MVGVKRSGKGAVSQCVGLGQRLFQASHAACHFTRQNIAIEHRFLKHCFHQCNRFGKLGLGGQGAKLYTCRIGACTTGKLRACVCKSICNCILGKAFCAAANHVTGCTGQSLFALGVCATACREIHTNIQHGQRFCTHEHHFCTAGSSPAFDGQGRICGRGKHRSGSGTCGKQAANEYFVFATQHDSFSCVLLNDSDPWAAHLSCSGRSARGTRYPRSTGLDQRISARRTALPAQSRF